MATKSNILRNFKNIQCVIVPGVTIYVTNFKKHIYFWRFYSTSWRKGVPSLFSFSCNSFFLLEFYTSFLPRSYLVSSVFISKRGSLVSTETEIFTSFPYLLGINIKHARLCTSNTEMREKHTFLFFTMTCN